MTTQEIVAKLWNLCNVLRDDGITYHQYVTELTYILFLKMAKETDTEQNFAKGINLANGDNLTTEELQTNNEKQVILEYGWDSLKAKSGIEQYNYYKNILRLFGIYCTGNVQKIYKDAVSNIEEPKNLEKIITTIDELDWYSAREEGLGNLYEGLLEKNVGEKKSGAGQYFTPRVLIDVMVRLMKPQAKELCNDKRQAYLIQANGNENSPKALDIRDSGEFLILDAYPLKGRFRGNRPKFAYEVFPTGANKKAIV